jgi:hypothetical protein
VNYFWVINLLLLLSWLPEIEKLSSYTDLSKLYPEVKRWADNY